MDETGSLGPKQAELETLTPLFDGWLADLLDAPIPREANATCDDCAMLPPDDGRRLPVREAYYRPETKCCTYLPELPNFLVGAILTDPETADESVRARMEDAEQTTPLGLGAGGEHVLRSHGSAGQLFGRDTASRCPHYLPDSGRCAIWRHRHGPCATFFCKHVRGGTGLRFWSRLRHLLLLVEQALAYDCALKLGIDADVLHRSLLPPHPDSRESKIDGGPPSHAELWGSWSGREQELFVESERLVSGLDWDDVLSRCGPEVAVAARAVRQSHQGLLDEAPPPRLRAAPVTVLDARPDGAVVVGYAGSDPLRLPRGTLELLHLFDGRRTTAEVLAHLREATGLRIHPSFVRKLADFRILVAAE